MYNTTHLVAMLTHLLEVRGELVEQVVDDVGGEDADAHGLCQVPRLPRHWHIER